MVARRFPVRITRLHALLVSAVILATLAVPLNYSYWRGRAAREAQAARVEAAASSQAALRQRAEAAEHERAEAEKQAAALTRRVTEDPHDARARFALAEVDFRRRDYARALDQLDVLRQQQPNNAEVPLRQAIVLKQAGHPDQAVQAGRRALSLRPGWDVAAAWLAELYLQRGDAEEALKLFDLCLKTKPDTYLALVGKGRALEELFRRQHPIAIADMVAPMERAVAMNGSDPLALLVLARMKFAYMKQPVEAEALARRAAALDPRNSGPYILLAEIALAEPPTPESLRRAGEYAYEGGKRKLDDPRPPYQLGRVYLVQNDVPRAVRALERSVSLGAMPEAVSQLSMAYRRSGNAERADYYAGLYQRYTERMERRDSLLREVAHHPREVDAYYSLARLYLEAGEAIPARNWLLGARHLNDADPRYATLMAEAGALQKKARSGPVLPIP